MTAFLQAHGGVLAVALLVVVIFNVFMSAAAQLFTALGKQEPAWMQTAGAWGLKIAQWMSANTPTPGTVQVTQVQLGTKPPSA